MIVAIATVSAKRHHVDPVARIGDPAPVTKRFAAPVTRTGEQDGKHSPHKCYMISQLGLIYNYIYFYILFQNMILPELHQYLVGHQLQTKISARSPIASSTENCVKLWSDCLLQRTRCRPWKIKCVDLNAERECTKNAVQDWWGVSIRMMILDKTVPRKFKNSVTPALPLVIIHNNHPWWLLRKTFIQSLQNHIELFDIIMFLILPYQ